MARKLQRDCDIYALPSTKSKPHFVRDGVVSNLFVRVGAGGRKTFVMRARFGQAKDPATRTIGDAFKMSLECARETAIRWNNLNRKGVDPWEEATLAELEAERYRRQTFRHVLQDYIATLPFRPDNRKSEEDAATLRREFLDPERVPWLDDPIRAVRGADVQRAIEAIRDRGAPTQAFNVFSHQDVLQLGDNARPNRRFRNDTLSRGKIVAHRHEVEAKQGDQKARFKGDSRVLGGMRRDGLSIGRVLQVGNSCRSTKE